MFMGKEYPMTQTQIMLAVGKELGKLGFRRVYTSNS